MKKHEPQHHAQAYRPKPPFRIIEGIDNDDSGKILDPFGRLSPQAVWILARFYSKFRGRNRANLSLTYSEVKSRMSGVVFIRSIWELIGFGFVDVRRFGRLERNASLYALSDRWRGLRDPKKCDEIGATLEEIRLLQRETGSVEKRGRLCALRGRLLGKDRP